MAAAAAAAKLLRFDGRVALVTGAGGGKEGRPSLTCAVVCVY